MGFLKDLLKDISQSKKPISFFQKKIIDFVNHMVLLSYNQLSISNSLAIEKAIVLLKEIDEVSNKLDNKFEQIKVYHVDGDIQTNVEEARIAVHELFNIWVTQKNKIKHSTMLIAFGIARSKLSKHGR